jgi:hypothetical protein
VKARGSTPGRPWQLLGLSTVGAGGIPGVAVECVEIRKNTGGEGGPLGRKARKSRLTLRRDSVGSKQD